MKKRRVEEWKRLQNLGGNHLLPSQGTAMKWDSCFFNSSLNSGHFGSLNRGQTFENHLEETLLDQAQVRLPYTPLFSGHSCSIPKV